MINEIVMRKILHKVLSENTSVMYIPDLAPYIIEELNKDYVIMHKDDYKDAVSDWKAAQKTAMEVRRDTAKEIRDSIITEDTPLLIANVWRQWFKTKFGAEE